VSEIQSLSLCARITWDLHNLNNEGTEGNQQQTRMVHIVNEHGERCNVNAVSGDMLKHIFVSHLTPLLECLGEPLSEGAKRQNPDRVNIDSEFLNVIKKNREGSRVLQEVISRCAVTDIAGTLITEGGAAIARKSCVEFGWVVGIPQYTHTEQYFHVKYAPETRAANAGQEERGEGTVAGRQAIFYRPANSGMYALICHLELERIGKNDITRETEVSKESQSSRRKAALHALAATLIKPSGAQRNTQSPHIVACEGILSTSRSCLPAPTISPLSSDYRNQMELIAKSLNKIKPDTVKTHRFEDLASIVTSLELIAAEG
jgi:CRISPR-associated protein Cst2